MRSMPAIIGVVVLVVVAIVFLKFRRYDVSVEQYVIGSFRVYVERPKNTFLDGKKAFVRSLQADHLPIGGGVLSGIYVLTTDLGLHSAKGDYVSLSQFASDPDLLSALDKAHMTRNDGGAKVLLLGDVTVAVDKEGASVELLIQVPRHQLDSKPLFPTLYGPSKSALAFDSSSLYDDTAKRLRIIIDSWLK